VYLHEYASSCLSAGKCPRSKCFAAILLKIARDCRLYAQIRPISLQNKPEIMRSKFIRNKTPGQNFRAAPKCAYNRISLAKNSFFTA
jgi:hypothetical protein